MAYPVAVAPSVRTPGAYLLVNLLAGVASPGTGALRALLIGPKVAGGSLADDTLRTNIASADEVAEITAYAPVALAARRLFEEHGIAAVDLICPPAPATVAASNTLTFAGTPTVTWTYTLTIAGRAYQGSWLAGQTHIDFADTLRQLILGKTRDLPVTASDNNLGVLTVTFKTTGRLGNDVILEFEMVGGTTGTVDGGTAKVTKNLASGTGEFDPDDSLAVVQGTEYAFIVGALGNADLTDAASTSAAAKIQAHIDALDTGAEAKLQQTTQAITSTHADALTAAGNRNHGPTELLLAQAFRSLPMELAAAEAGARMREEAEDPAVNRIGMLYRATIYGPIDPVASALAGSEPESALQNGVTPVKRTSNGGTFPVRPITTYFEDTNDNPDDRILDVSRVSGTYAVARDLRSLIPQRYPNKKLIRDLPAGSDPPGPTTIQEKQVRTTVVQRVGDYWGTTREVVKKADFDAAIANGDFICRVNDTDAGQLDLVIPIKIIPPLAKFSIVVNHVGP